MKTFIQNIYISLILIVICVSHAAATSYTWTGTTSRAWNTTTNWNPNGLPDSVDNVTIVTTTNSPLLSAARKVNNLTMTSGTLDLAGYALIIKGMATFNGGTIQNGTVKPSGLLGHFGGTHFNATIIARCGYFHMNGGQFDLPVALEDTGYASTTGTGNCTFNDSLTIVHNGTAYFTLASTYGDDFNGPVTLTNYSTREINIASSDTSFFNHNIILNSTHSGGILFGNTSGVSILASGKTLSIGSTGFDNDYVTLKKFIQLGSTSQTLTLTGTGVVNFIDCVFNGNLVVSAAGFLLKNSSFNGTSSFTKNSTANYQSDGGNIFGNTVTITNNGSAGRIRMATTTADTYNGDALFNSSGQDVQIAYFGNNLFKGNITTNSNKVVFNTVKDSKVTFNGSNNQTLNGSNNYSFRKVAFNKTAGTITANTTLSVDDSLVLISGNLITTGTNLLTMKAGSYATGANNNSFIEGPVKKVGNSDFIFPVGSSNMFKPLGISAPSTITSAFTSEFINDSILINSGNKDSTLGYLYRDQYWLLNRNVGTDNLYITLKWDSLSSVVDTFVTVASWNGTVWNDLGRGVFYGNTTSGSVTGTIAASSFNEFTLGYTRTGNPAANINCSNIQNAAALQSCLYTSASNSILVVTSSFAIDEPFISLPLPISDLTLIGVSGTNTNLGWWDLNSPLLTSSYTHSFTNANCACSTQPPAGCPTTTQCEPQELFLFKMEAGATIQNIRIRGANCNYQDYNNDDNLCGGIYILNDPSGSPVNINNCELSCFSYAGIFKEDENRIVNINNSYIHKVKGRASRGIGYGSWNKGVANPDPSLFYTVTFNNTLFDDCKAAIDGQGDPVDWIISDCTFSQFFISEDINKHNDNRFKLYDSADANPFDYHYCYTSLTNCNSCFYGPACSSYLGNCSSTCTSYPQPNFRLLDFNNEVPVYDVGGANTIIENSIFHKKWPINQNGNISLTLPNWDTGINMSGDITNSIYIRNNTFATALNSLNYARIADNYIEAPVWSGELRTTPTNNNHGYVIGKPVPSNSVQPFELSLGLQVGSADLNKSGTPSPNENQKYIQYINAGSAFNVVYEVNNPISGTIPFYIIRPNPNNGAGTGGNFSSENYFYDLETITGSGSPNITYDQPGLYGIDVMGFDTQIYGLSNHKFKTSSWQHIPIIVKDDLEEQVLYFNIKDSYQQPSTLAIDIFKEVRLNNTVIWSESISDGGSGWEYVRVDLSTTAIKSLINTDGQTNILSFDIFTNGVSTEDVIGLYVWIDDVYIKKSGSSTGDNLIRDGSIELGGKQGLGSGLTSGNYWFSNSTPALYSCVINSVPTSPDATANINSIERKSGNYAIALNMPVLNECDQPLNYGTNEIVASVGTTIDFTDFLSCDDYWNGTTSAVGFVPFPAIGSVTGGMKYFVPANIALSGQPLTLNDCILAFPSDIGIVVTGTTATLIIDNTYWTNGNPHGTHLFGCANMWDGINNNDGFLNFYGNVTNNDSKIEDAKIAVLSNGGKVDIRSITFDHNGLDINLDGTINAFSSQPRINGCNFFCTDEVISKSPFMGAIPEVHIVINGISNYTVLLGTPLAGSGVLNHFSDAINAANITNSKIIVQGNTFSRIYKRDDGNLTNDYGRTINIRNNGTAINYYTEIKDNEFNNVNLGINIDNIIGSELTIKNNTFNNPDYIFDPSPNMILYYNHRTAIKIQNPIPSPAIKAEIYGNDITGFRIGIHTLNIPEINIGTDVAGTLISGNTIQFDKTNFPLTSFYEGIWLQNCPNAKVANNDVTNTTVNEDINFRGLDIESSSDCNINCNNIDYLGVGINIWDNCGLTRLRNNTISHFFTGVWLNGPNGANIDADQGDPITSITGDSWENRWDWNAAIVGSLKVFGNVFGSGQINWYHQGTDINTNDFSTNPRSPIIINPKPTNTIALNLCTTFIKSDPNRRDNFGPIIGDSAVYVEDEDKSRYLAYQNSYIAMKYDTTLIYRGDSLDTSFQSFFAHIDSSNIGKFQKVKELAITWPDSANTINTSISDTNELEYHLKTFYTLFFSKIINGDSLIATDSTFLEGILEGTPITQGQTFYYSAAVLFREMHPESYSSLRIRNELAPVEPVKATPILSIIKIFPNPANIAISAQVTNGDDKIILIEIYSSLGSLILSNNCNENLVELNIQSFIGGLYKLRTVTANGKIENKIFSIIR